MLLHSLVFCSLVTYGLSSPVPIGDCEYMLPFSGLTIQGVSCEGRCVPKCDGTRDCEDGYDEKHCPAETTTTEEATTGSQGLESSGSEEHSLFPSREEITITGSKERPVSVSVYIDHIKNSLGTNKSKPEEDYYRVIVTEVKEKKKRFELVHDKANWVDANTRCKSTGGELASINSREENSAAWWKLINSEKTVYRAWLGGICPAKGEPCYWTDSWKRFNFSSWYAGEPNHVINDKEEEMCVQFHLRETYFWNWNDDLCSKQLPFICQYFDD